MINISQLFLMNSEVITTEFLRLGKPFGKELQSFNLQRLYELGNGTIKATFDTCVEGFTTPMGVEVRFKGVSHGMNFAENF